MVSYSPALDVVLLHYMSFLILTACLLGQEVQNFLSDRIIAAFAAIEGLWRDTKVATGESGIVPRWVVVVKPFGSLSGLFRQSNRDACQAPAPGIMLT